MTMSTLDISTQATPDSLSSTWQKITSGVPVTFERDHLRRDGTTFPVEVRVGCIEIGGRLFRFSLARDISERKQAEDKIKASLAEKEVLLKEINHRVKNNMQIISSLISLQSNDIVDEETLRVLRTSQDRIKAMALVHEKLYRSEDLARIDFRDYLQSLATDLRSSYGLGARLVELNIEVENLFLGVDKAIPCGVIANELVSNSLKHAFSADRAGEITISFRLENGEYYLVVRDNGVGLPMDLDIENASSLGLTIVNALTSQLRGTVKLCHNGGAEITIAFPAD